jgi:hypothetical protein
MAAIERPCCALARQQTLQGPQSAKEVTLTKMLPQSNRQSTLPCCHTQDPTRQAPARPTAHSHGLGQLRQKPTAAAPATTPSTTAAAKPPKTDLRTLRPPSRTCAAACLASGGVAAKMSSSAANMSKSTLRRMPTRLASSPSSSPMPVLVPAAACSCKDRQKNTSQMELEQAKLGSRHGRSAALHTYAGALPAHHSHAPPPKRPTHWRGCCLAKHLLCAITEHTSPRQALEAGL